MEICMLDPLFYPYLGGAEKVVFEVGKRLARRHEVTILTSGLPKTTAYEGIEGMNIYRTSSIYLTNLPSFMPPPYTISPFFVLDLIKRRSADVFHIHNRFWYYLGTLLTIKLLLRKKLVLTLHNAKPEGISFSTDNSAALYDFVWGRRIMENANRITAVSRYTRDVTVPKGLHYKTEVIYNGVDVERFTPRSDGSEIRKKFGVENQPLLLTNARLITQKGLSYLIDALVMLKKEIKDANLIIIGKGPLKDELAKQAVRNGIQDSVFFVTGIPEEELPLYYNAADLFVLPSVWEPSPLVIYEALASGKAIVATNVGGTPEIMTQECGFLVKPKDANEIYEKVKFLLENDDLRMRMEKKARERAVENFTWEILAEKMEAIYKKI
jgi:glycosyltransferase involved in cell wall biosynthesis